MAKLYSELAPRFMDRIISYQDRIILLYGLIQIIDL